MRVAVIGGTGIRWMAQQGVEADSVETPYGPVQVWRTCVEDDEVIFLPRHGPDHHLPPHRVNYRANIKALQQLGVKRVMAAYAVGSLHAAVPPRSLVALDQLLDFTRGRQSTFYDGGASGVVHTDMTEPFCPALRARLLERAEARGLGIVPRGTYICTEGPRIETAAEVRMFAQLGGDVVGMTGVPEAPLARELGLHYAAVALAINWGAGIKAALEFVREGLEEVRAAMLDLFVDVLRSPNLPPCGCQNASMVVRPPQDRV